MFYSDVYVFISARLPRRSSNSLLAMTQKGDKDEWYDQDVGTVYQ